MKVPSSILCLTNVETGKSKPSCLFIGSTISLINAGTSFVAVTSVSTASTHVAGTSILTIAPTPASIAALFILTTFSPFLPYDVTTACFKYAIASSTGIILASLKNAACIIMLILPPRPIS